MKTMENDYKLDFVYHETKQNNNNNSNNNLWSTDSSFLRIKTSLIVVIVLRRLCFDTLAMGFGLVLGQCNDSTELIEHMIQVKLVVVKDRT